MFNDAVYNIVQTILQELASLNACCVSRVYFVLYIAAQEKLLASLWPG